MARNLDHDMLVPPTAEEAARQRFVLAFKQHLGRHLRPHNRTIYEAGAKPRFEARHGRAPQSFEEIAQSLYGEPLYQTWCSLNRTAQEMMWDAVAAPIDREGDQLSRRFRERSGAPDRRGSLRLNPALEPPDGLARVHVHLQPDGYLADTGEDDVRAGALYEAGGALYSQGQSIGTMESKADCVVRFLADRHPGLEPTRILDMACSAGSSTVPYALAFPEAEVHGVDVAPAMLRYAHARAEALGVAIHFHQMSGAHGLRRRHLRSGGVAQRHARDVPPDPAGHDGGILPPAAPRRRVRASGRAAALCGTGHLHAGGTLLGQMVQRRAVLGGLCRQRLLGDAHRGGV